MSHIASIIKACALAAAFVLGGQTAANAEPWRSADGLVEVVIPEGWATFPEREWPPEFVLFVATPNAFQDEIRAEACQVLRAENPAGPQSELNGDLARYAENHRGRYPDAAWRIEDVRGVLVYHSEGLLDGGRQREVMRAFSAPIEGAAAFYILMCRQTLDEGHSPVRIDSFISSFRLNAGVSE